MDRSRIGSLMAQLHDCWEEGASIVFIEKLEHEIYDMIQKDAEVLFNTERIALFHKISPQTLLYDPDAIEIRAFLECIYDIEL